MPLNVQCKRCSNLKNGWCESVIDSPDPDLNRDCQHFRAKLNYDKICAMTIEELAEFIGDDTMHDICPNNCQNDLDRPCKVCALDWLRQEAEP